MDKKKIITVISIVITIIVITVSAVLIIHENNKTTKTVIAENNIDDKLIDETNEPTEVPTEEPVEESATPIATPTPHVPQGKYYIKVNNQMNTVTVYTKDSQGNYTIPVKAMVCSTGYASPKNSKYKTQGKWNWGKMFGGVYTQYETLITGNILFHSVPYLKQYDPSSLEYWAYDQLGTTCSAGCIRLTVADSKWIYDNCAVGTTVEFYSSSNPGPLGKPTAMKISNYTEYRGWDPTDPDPNNPWKNYVEETPTPEPTPIETPDVSETPVIPSEEPTNTPIVTPVVTPTAESTSTPIINPIVTPTGQSEQINSTATPNATPTANVPTILSTNES